MSICSIIAHRGLHSNAPENTIASFLAAARIGADMAELDVRLTRDGVPVIYHDADVTDRVGKKYAVGSLGFIRLRKIQIEKYTQKKAPHSFLIPTLKDIVRKILPHLALNVELKPEIGREVELAAEVLKNIPARYNTKIIYSSFSKKILKILKLRRPNIRLGLLFKSDIHTNMRWAKQNGCYSIHPKITVCNRALISVAHQKGLRVIVWTVNNLRKAGQLQAWGADGLISDVPQNLLKLT